MAAELRELYYDIDAVELYTGLILEKRRSKQLFGETLTEMGAPYSLKGIAKIEVLWFMSIFPTCYMMKVRRQMIIPDIVMTWSLATIAQYL